MPDWRLVARLTIPVVSSIRYLLNSPLFIYPTTVPHFFYFPQSLGSTFRHLFSFLKPYGTT